MQIIILAAGSGSRMEHLTDNQHKSLLKINQEESFLSNILHKLNEYEISKVILVTGYLSDKIEEEASNYQMNIETIKNHKYKDDINIFSMKLALEKLSDNENTIIIESDIIFDDLAFKEIYFSSTTDKSIWYTRGRFNNEQYGGILRASSLTKKIDDIKIVPQYENIYANYYKLLGITTIGKNEFYKFKKFIDEYSDKTIKQYYLIPWIENLKSLPCYMFDLNSYNTNSINTPSEYYNYIEKSTKNKKIRSDFSFISINKFNPIEDYIIQRKDILKAKIESDKYWTKPIIADKDNYLIMDGHHRFQVAKELGLKKIPTITIDYREVPIWSLKKNEVVNKELVVKRALEGQIYPNKTVKHSFPFEVDLCEIPIGDLK